MSKSSRQAPSLLDLALWPDGDWCYAGEISEYRWKSDDYEIIPFESPVWRGLMKAEEAPSKPARARPKLPR